MIDEDLYQLAADELNTDKRRPHIWARACALSSDDHDEARYLYTNLRVEEMIAERETAGGSSPAASATSSDTSDDSLSLEPLDFSEESPQSVSTPSGMDLQEDPEADSLTLGAATGDELDGFEAIQSRNFEDGFESKSGSDNEQPLDDLSLEDDFLDETINLTSELDGTAVFELDKADASDSDDTQADDQQVSADEELEALLGGVYEAGAPVDTQSDNADGAMTADFSDVSGAHGVLDDDDMSWLEERNLASGDDLLSAAEGELQKATDDLDDALTMEDFQDTDRLARELERQAAEILGEDIGENIDDEALSEQSDNEAGDASDEEQLALVLDQDSAPAQDASSDSTGPSRMDSIFDSIEHDADEAVSRLNENLNDSPFEEDAEESLAESHADSPTESQPDSLASADEDAFTGDDNVELQLEDDERKELETEPEVDTALEEPVSAAAMSAHQDTDAEAAVGKARSTVPGIAVASAAAAVAGTVASSTNIPDISAVSATGRTPRETTTADDSAAVLPLDLTEESDRGSRYNVFRRDSKTQAVKQGVSWSALFLTLPFLVYRHLFGTALVYTIMWLILVAGLLISGLAWLDAGSAASMAIKGSTIGFAILAFIGLLYLPFRHANQWRENKLEQRGFEHVALVRDRSPGKAISQVRNAAGLD